MNIFKKNNTLTFYLEEITCRYGTPSYRDENKISRKNIEKIISKFKKNIENDDQFVSIESIFNNIRYPFFDLDTNEKLMLFKQLFLDKSYVIFQSSTDHFWGIVDEKYKFKKDIFYDFNWKSCNDINYIEFSRENNILTIRGLYENEERKPKLYETRGVLSKNFQLFISELIKYYDNEGLELSVLRYKDPTLLIKLNRKLKLKHLQKTTKFDSSI